jgi:hypothetical protein
MLLVLLLGFANFRAPPLSACAADPSMKVRAPADDEVSRLQALLKGPLGFSDVLEILRLSETVPEKNYGSEFNAALEKKLFPLAAQIAANHAAEKQLSDFVVRMKRRNPLADFILLFALPNSPQGLDRPSAVYLLKFGGNTSVPIRQVSIRDGWRVGNLKRSAPVQDYGKNLAESLEFIDYLDFARDAVHDRGNPWTKYDEYGKTSLLDRWRSAKALLATSKQTARTPLGTLELLKGIHTRLSGVSEGVRSHPIIAGGDVYVYDKGYYPVSAEEVAVMEKNPYLTVEAIPNPYPGVHSRFLARHEYPSVRHYRKWKDRLPADLYSLLEAAEANGTLNDFGNGDTQALNRRLIESLIQELFTRSEKQHYDPATTYQELMSIHPFSDYNGRSLRLLYQSDDEPLFLVDWNNDLFLSRNDFIFEAEKGRWRRRDLIQNLAEMEQAHPEFPKYYEAPEIYRVLADIDEPNLKAFAGKKGEFERLFSSDSLTKLIQQKRFFEAQEELRSYCVRLFGPK